MYRLIYPAKTQELFVNKVAELEILDSYKNRLLQGEANKIALIGNRRIGKSTILYEFIKRNLSNRELSLVYINLQGLVIEPLSFAKSYVGLITKWFIKDTANNFAHYDDLQFFSGSYIRLMQNILEKSDSPLFGQINPYYISHFDKETALKLIDKIGRLQQLDIATAIKKKMLQLTSGHPFLLNYLPMLYMK